MTRTRALVVAAALVVACGACSSTPAEPPDPPASGPPPAAAFTATVTPGNGALAITYTFTNQTSADLVALDRVPTGNQHPVDAVYVTGRGNDGEVEVSKRAFARPDSASKEWTSFNSIGGVVVAPGKSVSENFTVPLPLARHHPYGNDIGDGEITLPDPVQRVVFCLGVLPRSALPASSTTDDAGTVETVHSSLVTASQHLFCSPPAKP